MSADRNLHKAKSNKKDEFYTQLVDEDNLRVFRFECSTRTMYC